METKIKNANVAATVTRLGYIHCFFFPARAHAGGLCVCYKQGITVEPIHIDGNMITIIFYQLPSPHPWMCSFIYGPPYQTPKPAFWKKLTSLIESFPGPWLGIGDLNEVLTAEEKEGGQPYSSSSSSGLSYVMMQQGLLDLGYNGNEFTWTNKREGPANIKE